MNSSPAQAESHGERASASPWIWALAASMVCLVAVSSQSLWIDEAFMASKASQPTLADWWHTMPKGNGSDLQMPLYMIYMWAFAKIFGLGEWALRAANIPWFVTGAAAFIVGFPKPQRYAAAAVTLFCPFAWFYLNEARPYAMQLGASLVIFAALYRLSETTVMSSHCERNCVVAFWLAVIVLCGSSLLGVIWAGAAFVCLPILFPLKRLAEFVRTHWLACVLSLVVLAALACYYVWTIKFGTRGLEARDPQEGNAALTAVKSAAHFRQGFAGGTEWQNFAFVIYELLGFSGLGPGRIEIRASGLSAFRHFAPQLALYALALGLILLMAVRRLAREPAFKKRIIMAVIAVCPLLLLTVAGYFLGFRILGRHCTPLIPVLLFVLSTGLVSAFLARNAVLKGLTGVFLLGCLCSCLALRFAARHEKDDYRDAAQLAIAAATGGQKVWWSAAEDGAAYYHVPMSTASAEQGRALLVLNPTPVQLSSLPAPDLVIASKPDLYDNQEAVLKYVRNNPYSESKTFPAFTVWKRKSGLSGH